MQSVTRRRRTGAVLWVLTALFAFRVVAQPLSLVTSILPPFDAWDSGVMPYGWLLTSQLLILVVLVVLTRRVIAAGNTTEHRGGRWIVWLGVVYFAAMAVRLVLGATLLRESNWFAHPVPTIFHLVLAAYVILYGRVSSLGAAA